MMHKMDLTKVFKASICSFEVAKQAAVAGMTCANTYFAYDEKGVLSDGGWLGPVTGAKFYPAINKLLALYMATEETTIELDDTSFGFYCDGGDDFFMFEYRGDQIKTNNFTDLCVLVWIKYKYPEEKPVIGSR